MIEQLPSEQRNPHSERIDAVSTREMLEIINREDALVAAAVEAEIPHIAEAVDAIAERFEKGGRLFYVGAGTSGRLAVLDAVEESGIGDRRIALWTATEIIEDSQQHDGDDYPQNDVLC